MAGSFMERLGLRTPIIQAPMAGISTPRLAAAVSNAGGLGSLGIGASSVSDARRAIRETRSLTHKPFNVNVFNHAPALKNAQREEEWLAWLAPHFAKFNSIPPVSLREIYTSFVDDEPMLAMLVEERPAVVSFHFGLPPDTAISALRAAGIELMATATNLEEAREIAKKDIGAVVAQGVEAGGHRGTFDPRQKDEHLGTLTLTRLLANAAGRPIIAAGGIMDGAGIAAALALGAHAAQLGTAFVPCPETSIDESYRQALLSPTATTTITSSLSGRPARSLENVFTALDRDPHRPMPPDYPIAYDAGKTLHAAAKAHGVFGYGAQWAGQSVTLSRALPAAQLLELLNAELMTALRHLAHREP